MNNCIILKMYKAYKYRIYPNKEQQEIFEKIFGCCRFVYNWGLDKKIKLYKENKEKISCFQLINEMVKLKDKEETKWLKEVPARALLNSLSNLDSAFTRFFREKKGFPKFKSKHNNYKSFQLLENVKLENNKIYLQKKFFKKYIKAKTERFPEGKYRSCTISQVPSGKYFISFLYELPKQEVKQKEIKYETTIGIDLGIKKFATLSDGRKIDNPKHLKSKLKRIKCLSKRLSRKQKGSENRNKARIKLANAYEKVNNCRKDFLHKLTTQLVNENQIDTFAFESLNINGMLKNHRLARHIADCGWRTFIDYLTYKANRIGKNIIFCGTFDATSQICNNCGYQNSQLKDLKIRDWICPNCNNHNDRDINAAENIRLFAIQKQNLITDSQSGRACGEVING